MYAAGLLQGLALVTFPAASAVFTNGADYGLTTAEYGVMFAPQTIIAILVSVLGGRFVERWGAKRVFLAGLAANLASMALLVGSRFVMHDHDPAFGLLLAATGLLGVGFGLTVPVVNRLAAALFPGRVNVAILALNALLGLGTALAPLLIAVFVGLGAWWGLPITVGALLAILLTFSAPLPLRAGAAAAAKEAHSKKFWLFCGFALGYGVVETLNGNWAILYMKGVLHAPASLAAIALTAVLGRHDRGPRPLRGGRSLDSSPRHLPAAAVGDRPRLRRDRAGPRVVARSRRRQLRARRARLLGVAAADDQPRPRRRAARGSDRLVPGRLRPGGVRGRAPAQPRGPQHARALRRSHRGRGAAGGPGRDPGRRPRTRAKTQSAGGVGGDESPRVTPRQT